ncbi:MAG: endolytic transglycosylase MltG [Terriglobia bacterium]
MKKWLGIILLLVVILAGAWTAKELYFPYRGYAGSVILVIQPGTNAPEAASLLQSRGVLAHRLPFLFRYWLGRRRHETIKFGEYQFRRPMSASEVYEKLVRGEVYLHAVVIPEGSDRLDMARIFEQEVGLNPDSFLAATRDPAAIRDLDPQAPSLEGYLFPDTYRFPRGATASKIASAMLARFREVLNSQFRQDLPPGPDALHDAITLASLVEKETPNPRERPMVAGVFTRRLTIGMPLQCDPTVIYAVRLSQQISDPLRLFTGPLTRSDLEAPSPYNTYLHAGLPPGPICSPGAASIRAALHPAAGTALYFVSNNHGGHAFADTLSEQNRNVARYRKELKAQGTGKSTAGKSQ